MRLRTRLGLAVRLLLTSAIHLTTVAVFILLLPVVVLVVVLSVDVSLIGRLKLLAVFAFTAFYSWALWGGMVRTVEGGQRKLLAEVELLEEDRDGATLAGGFDDGTSSSDGVERWPERSGPGTASPLDEAERDRVTATLDRLVASAGTPRPLLGVHPTAAPLCYTVDHGDDLYLVVSRGLVRTLPDDELEAVLAHEVAHLANADQRFMTWVTLPVVMVELQLGRYDWSDITRRKLRSGLVESAFLALLTAPLLLASDGPLLPLLVRSPVAIAVVVLLVLVLFREVTLPVMTIVLSSIVEFGAGAFSRGREVAADEAAARLTGDPDALASALQRLDDSISDRPPKDLRAVSHSCDALNVLPALDPDSDGGGGLLATHPATEDRIERLQALERDQETA